MNCFAICLVVSWMFTNGARWHPAWFVTKASEAMPNDATVNHLLATPRSYESKEKNNTKGNSDSNTDAGTTTQSTLAAI